MAFRLYLVPSIGTGVYPDGRRAKYFRDDLPGRAFAAMDYGFQPVFLVGSDLNPTDEAFVLGHADASAFPVNLDVRLSSGEANNAVSQLEAKQIPAHWVNASITWRTCARTTAGMFQYFQRVHSYVGNMVVIDGTNQTLNTQFQNLPQNFQFGLLNAAQSFGYSTAFIANQTQLREVIKTFGDGWGTKPFVFGDNTI